MHSVGFENRVLRGIFRSEKEKQGDWQKVNNNFSSLPNLLGRFTHGEWDDNVDSTEKRNSYYRNLGL